jgi:hypothetical protein
MSKIVTFFRSLIKSCTNPSYYADIFRAKFSFSFKYFVLFQILTIVITAIAVMIPVARFDVPAAANEVVKVYPSDLAISFRRGELSINKPLPYAIPIQSDEPGPLLNWVVFDSNQHFAGIQNFSHYQALAVVTESAVYYRHNSSYEVRAIPFTTEMGDFDINESVIQQAKQTFLNMPAIKNKLYVPGIGIILFAVFLPFLFIVRWWTVMVYSFWVFLLTKILRKQLFANHKFSYSKVLQLSLHSITPIVVIAYLSSWFGQGWVLEGFWYFLAYLVWTCIVLNRVAVKVVAREVVLQETMPVVAAKPVRTLKVKKTKTSRKK